MTPQLPSISPSKRLIVCCDGTWVAGDHASKSDSSYQTNITRMCHALADSAVVDGKTIPQIIYYQSGVGSNIPTGFGRAFAGAFGYGVNENILAAYNFLVNNYTMGDELFFFGFSRGSFTCRSLAGLISHYGILKQEASGEWFAGIWDRYQGTVKDNHWDRIKSQVTHSVKIKVVGCWDTVGALGMPENDFTKFFNVNKKHAFHDTELSDKIENAFHALALDEHRKSFSPTLWYLPPRHAGNHERRTSLKQCWFAGVHTDVGRGYCDHVPGDIADITFAWMVDQCHSHLAFNEDKVRELLRKGDFKLPQGKAAEKEREERARKAQQWGLADLHDSMTSLFKMGGSLTRTPGQYTFKAHHLVHDETKRSRCRNPNEDSSVTDSELVANVTPKDKSWYQRFWPTVSGADGSQAEDVSNLTPVWTSEVIHPSVRVRMIRDPTYDPPALRGFKLMYHDKLKHWAWVKRFEGPNGEVREKRLHEDRNNDPCFSLRKEIPETLEFDREVPPPPRQMTAWFSFC